MSQTLAYVSSVLSHLKVLTLGRHGYPYFRPEEIKAWTAVYHRQLYSE